jgi:hypothetical protein
MPTTLSLLHPAHMHRAVVAFSENANASLVIATLCAIGASSALAAFKYSWRRWRISVQLAQTSSIRPSNVTHGIVETSGRAVLANPSAAVGPTSGVWFAFELQRLSDQGKHAEWVTKLEAASTHVFFITDEVGGVFVDPTGAIFDVPTETIDAPNVTPAQLLSMAQSSATPTDIDLHTSIATLRRHWRVVSRHIRVDSQVTAFGPVTRWDANPTVTALRADPSRPDATGRLFIASGSTEEVEQRTRRELIKVATAPLAFSACCSTGIFAVINREDWSAVSPTAMLSLTALLCVPFYVAAAVVAAADRTRRHS